STVNKKGPTTALRDRCRPMDRCLALPRAVVACDDLLSIITHRGFLSLTPPNRTHSIVPSGPLAHTLSNIRLANSRSRHAKQRREGGPVRAARPLFARGDGVARFAPAPAASKAPLLRRDGVAGIVGRDHSRPEHPEPVERGGGDERGAGRDGDRTRPTPPSAPTRGPPREERSCPARNREPLRDREHPARLPFPEGLCLGLIHRTQHHLGGEELHAGA